MNSSLSSVHHYLNSSARFLHKWCDLLKVMYHFLRRWGGGHIKSMCCKFSFTEALTWRKTLIPKTVLKKHNGCKFLNKACLYSHQHQVLQVHSHKHKHIQSFFVVCFFGTQSTYWAKHIISTNVGFYTFLLVRTVMYVSYLTEERRVWPLFSVTSWFVLEAWKQGQITEEHPNTAFSEQQCCVLKFTHSLWHVHFSVLPFIQSPAFVSDT